MKFDSVEQVTEVLGHNFTGNQYIMILNYIKYGVIPDPDGCLSCEPAYIRTIIGEMDAYQPATIVFIDPADIENVNAPTVAELNKALRKK